MKKILILVFVTYIISQMNMVRADYVLPYPSYMPGNTLYRVSRVADRLKSYWYWGNIAQIKYHLSLSDKYLVEAKTLFEYKQYLLAVDALSRSDIQLRGLGDLVRQGEKNNEDMDMQRQTIREAMIVHQSVITTLKTQLPEEFVWKPEKSGETTLRIGELLTSSYGIRQKVSGDVTNR